MLRTLFLLCGCATCVVVKQSDGAKPSEETAEQQGGVDQQQGDEQQGGGDQQEGRGRKAVRRVSIGGVEVVPIAGANSQSGIAASLIAEPPSPRDVDPMNSSFFEFQRGAKIQPQVVPARWHVR